MEQARGLSSGGSQLDLGALTKFGAFSGILAYVIGTLTTNIYLHQLGIADFSFAKPKLILTGTLVLLTFFMLSLLPVSTAWGAAGGRGSKRRLLPFSRKTLVLLIIPLFGLIAASATLCFGESTGLGQIAVWEVWKLLKDRTPFTKGLASLIVAAEIYTPICFAAISAFAAQQLYDQSKSKTSSLRLVSKWLYLRVQLPSPRYLSLDTSTFFRSPSTLRYRQLSEAASLTSRVLSLPKKENVSGNNSEYALLTGNRMSQYLCRFCTSPAR